MLNENREKIAEELIVRLNQTLAGSGSSSPRERPISFAPNLIDLIVTGRKTQTRRPVRPANDYAVNDRLWVREKWSKSSAGYMLARLNPATDTHWYSPLFMPKSAAKLWLLVNEVCVEPIQSISNDDLIAEGFGNDSNPVGSFRAAWDTFYAQQGLGWQSNPNVIVVMFQTMTIR